MRRQQQRELHNIRDDWRLRTGVALVTDDWPANDDLLKFWDMGSAPYRQAEDLNEWLVVWTENTLVQTGEFADASGGTGADSMRRSGDLE